MEAEREEEEQQQRLLTSPPPYLFERLAQLPGYTWETHLPPFHSVGALMELRQHSAHVVYRPTTIGMFLDIGIFKQSLPQPRLMTREPQRPIPPRALHDWDHIAPLYDNMKPPVSTTRGRSVTRVGPPLQDQIQMAKQKPPYPLSLGYLHMRYASNANIISANHSCRPQIQIASM